VALRHTGFIFVPPGSESGFDHADCYRGERIYVAHTGADRIDVIDIAERRHLRSLGSLPGVAGVLIDQDRDLLFSSDRGCARVSAWRCSDEELVARIDVGAHPNGLAYDPGRRRLHVFNLGDPPGHDSTASLVDLDTARVVATIPLPGRPRWAMYDRDRDVVFANVSHPPQILVISADTFEAERAIDVPVDGPHGLAIDGRRLYCAADGGAVVVLDADSGSVDATLPLPGVPDVAWHDATHDRLYIAVGDPGCVSVFDTKGLTHVETVETEQGAHTTAWNPATCELYVFQPLSTGAAVYVDE
jgi:DNA-binding beta-propeller fold protein YncE